MTEALRRLFGRLVELRLQADSYPDSQRPRSIDEELLRCQRLISAELKASAIGEKKVQAAALRSLPFQVRRVLNRNPSLEDWSQQRH